MPDDLSTVSDRTNPFLDQNEVMFSDVVRDISEDHDLPPTKRRDVVSDIQCLLRLLNLNPETTPARAGSLTAGLKKLHPVQANISSKRLANMKSNALYALRHLGISQQQHRYATGLSTKWRTLRDTIPDEQVRWKLSRLFHYGSASEIDPETVNDETIEKLLVAVTEENFVTNPESTVGQSIYAWNRCQAEISGWPGTRLTRLPEKRTTWTFKLDQFPGSFAQEAAVWKSKLEQDDPFDEDAIPRPLRPATINHRMFQLRMFASALVRRNLPIDRITSLGVLVELSNFKEAIRYMLDRNDGKSTESIYGCAMAMKLMARHRLKLSEDQIRELDKICSRIRVKNRGLTKRNKRRLAQFDDPFNVAQLLLLPETLDRLATRSSGRKAALLMQMAVAIEILSLYPLRRTSLVALELGNTIYWTRPARKGRLVVSLPADRVKNNVQIDFEIPKESVPLIMRYLDEYQSQLFEDPGNWIFPGANGDPKDANTLSRQIKNVIFKHTGIEMNAHLFRHAMAKLYLDRNPASYEVVRRVLGHQSMDTTVQSYADLQNPSAVRHFDETILERRREAENYAGRKRRRLSK